MVLKPLPNLMSESDDNDLGRHAEWLVNLSQVAVRMMNGPWYPVHYNMPGA